MKTKIKSEFLILLGCLLIIVLSVSLAYYKARIEGEGVGVSVVSQKLSIKFTSASNISSTAITPGWTNTSTFTVTNNSDDTYKYNIVIEDLINTFVTEGYLQYKITSTNDGYNMTDYIDIPKSNTPTDTILAYSVSIPKDVTQEYTVTFRYLEDESIDQSEDMGKILSGTIFITEGTEKPNPTLYNQILADNPTVSTRTDFSTVLTSNTTGTIFTATEKNVHNTTDTTVYYYAGNTTNNWVKFGQYSGDYYIYRGCKNADCIGYLEFPTKSECESDDTYNYGCDAIKKWSAGDNIYWRIIRTNADGSVRLLYHGTSVNSTDSYINFTEGNVNYMYDPDKINNAMAGEIYSGTIRLNKNDSSIKKAVDSWYNTYLQDYTSYLSNTAVYCNDRSNECSESDECIYYFNAHDRTTPTYDCTIASDAFSGSNSSAKLTYPVAIMTKDEIMYAGGKSETDNSTVWYELTAEEISSVGLGSWWLMTPSYACGNGDADVYKVQDWLSEGDFSAQNSGYLTTEMYWHVNYIRPVLSVVSNVKVNSGNGTASSPYELTL